MKTRTFAMLAVMLCTTLGCEVPELDVPESTAAPVAAQTPSEEAPIEDMEPPVTSTPRAVTANDPSKGKKSRAVGGYLGAVGHSRFYAEHSMIFNNIKHALNLYWGEHGEYPQSHDEFMKKIVKFNQIKLPDLDEGVEYLYDPEDHLLKIWRPNADADDAPGTGSVYIGDVATGEFGRKHQEVSNDLAEAAKNFNDEHGRNPKTHKEFMEKIVQANQLQLPELDPGMEYVYDPKEQMLKIYRMEE